MPDANHDHCSTKPLLHVVTGTALSSSAWGNVHKKVDKVNAKKKGKHQTAMRESGAYAVSVVLVTADGTGACASWGGVGGGSCMHDKNWLSL